MYLIVKHQNKFTLFVGAISESRRNTDIREPEFPLTNHQWINNSKLTINNLALA